MTRQSTVVQDSRILKLHATGIHPKKIATRLRLTSVYVVYEALRRKRLETKTKIHQNFSLENFTTTV